MEDKNRKLFATVNYLLDKGSAMTNLKLQKMLFFFYGLHICLHDESPFEANIEAWKYGPVFPEVYHEFRDNGKSEIVGRANVSEEELEEDFPALHEFDDKKIIQSAKATLIYYNRFSATDLVEQSHELSCWSKNYEETKRNKINSDDIKNNFKQEIMPKVEKYFDSL